MARHLQLLGLVLLAGCASASTRSSGGERLAEPPAGVLHLRWRTTVHSHRLFEPTPQECASGALADGRLVLGSRAASVVALDTALGGVAWATGVSGGVDSQAVYDGAHGLVYVGADDGTMHAIDSKTGAIRWTFKTRGAIERAVVIAGDELYLSSAGNRIVSLDASSGKWRWQYDREIPEGFAIHGYSGPALFEDNVIVGFADGYLVSLARKGGEVVWSRSLAGASEHFVDVDTTPAILGDTVFAASYSGGLHALNARDGTVRWRQGIEGVSSVHVVRDTLYFTAPREGLHAMDSAGHVLWRQGLAGAGDVTTPSSFGPYLVFSAATSGLIVVERATGALVQVFNPGSGVCGGPTVDVTNRRVYVLGNAGNVYALDVDFPGA